MSFPPSNEDMEQVLAAIGAGRKIEAVKLYRQLSGTGLKEAKDFVDALERKLRETSPDKFSAQPTGKGNRWIPLLLAAVFVLVGLGLMGYGGLLVSRAQESVGWPQTQGRIVRSRLIPRAPNEDEVLEIEYDYEVAGVSYTGSRIYFGDGLTLSSRGDARHYATRYPLDRRVMVAYAPEDPSHAVLEPGAGKLTYVSLASGWVFLLLGLAISQLIRRDSSGAATSALRIYPGWSCLLAIAGLGLFLGSLGLVFWLFWG